MKIQKVIFAAIICSYVQIANAAFDGEFIDPTDMEHYDQSTKTLKFTLKEKESHKMLKGLLQRLLISAENCGLADKKNHYDAEVILTRQAHVDISNFLNDKPCDQEVIQDYLNTIFINFKKHNEDEWKLKFKEFFQMDISKVQKLRIIEEMFTTHFKRILENTQKAGLADEENHYDAEVILTRQAHADISNFLKDKPYDPEVIQDYLNTILINFKKHNEDEWKLKFKEFYQMDISKVQKLQTTQDMLAKHFKRILEKAQKTGQKAILDGNIHLDDVEKEINKFLNDEDWDQKKMEIILENVAFNKDEGVNVWIYFGTFILVCVISYALSWIMKKIYWREPAQNEARNRVEGPEDDIDYQEEPFCLPVPETAEQNEGIQNIRREHQREPNAEQDAMDKGACKRLPTAQKFTQDEKKAKSPEQDNVLTVGANQADALVHWNERQEHADILNTEESNFPRTLETTVQNDAIERVRRDIQTEPSVQQDKKDVFSFIALEKDQDENQESYEQACSSEPLNQSSSSPNVVEIKDENSVETNQTLSHSLFNETTQVRTAHGVKESTVSPDYTQELSAEIVNVDIVFDTHRLQDSSMNVDDEADFIVISESAPESLTFVQDTTCNESV